MLHLHFGAVSRSSRVGYCVPSLDEGEVLDWWTEAQAIPHGSTLRLVFDVLHRRFSPHRITDRGCSSPALSAFGFIRANRKSLAHGIASKASIDGELFWIWHLGSLAFGFVHSLVGLLPLHFQLSSAGNTRNISLFLLSLHQHRIDYIHLTMLRTPARRPTGSAVWCAAAEPPPSARSSTPRSSSLTWPLPASTSERRLRAIASSPACV